MRAGHDVAHGLGVEAIHEQDGRAQDEQSKAQPAYRLFVDEGRDVYRGGRGCVGPGVGFDQEMRPFVRKHKSRIVRS